jgi:colanic acid/amylovoran biosynthesis glycosyltransferase
MSRLIQQKKWQERYRILFDKGDIFLVEGLYMKSALLKLGCPQEKIQIQRIAIPLDKINFLPRRPKRNNEKVILIFSGRFVEKKGLLYALKAVEKVKEDGRNIEFRVIGNGILKAEIERFIQIHRMGDYARLLGFLPYENYLKEMQKADIFILPSITAADGDSEGGAPTVILEAQAMGMPIISTYHGDIPNVVIPGKSALLSEEKNIGQLATNIAYLLDNQQIWETMGCCGREFVENYHDIRLEAERLEDKYRFIIQDLKKNTITYA